MSGLYQRAALYDLIYTWKDYRAEAARLADALNAWGVPDGATVLEACCGTGNYLVHLQERFDASGFDIAPEMVARARTKGVRADVADLRFFESPPVDALLCLFSSIGYLAPGDLPAVAERVRAALKPGGLAVIEPWLTSETFVDRHIHLQHATGDDVVAARTSTGIRDGGVSHIDMAWAIARPGQVEHFDERHTLHLLDHAALQAPFEDAGLSASWDDRPILMGRGLLVLRA